MPAFIGIDYHKAYSVYSVLDAQGDSLGQGRIDHAHPEDFRALVRRWLGCRAVFEAGMNWHWLFEILERELSSERIVLANPSCSAVKLDGPSLLYCRCLPPMLSRQLMSNQQELSRQMTAEEVSEIVGMLNEDIPEATTVARQSNVEKALADGSVHRPGIASETEIESAGPMLPADPPRNFEFYRGK
jgi:hypothetical protein